MNREELLKNAKPILFNTEMVQAILESRKTVTRRVIKPQPEFAQVYEYKGKKLYDCVNRTWCYKNHVSPDAWNEIDWIIQFAPYQVGDTLWVRETWTTDENFADVFEEPLTHGFYYKADAMDMEWVNDREIVKWRPSIHMPKKAARIFLKVTDVKVEWLQNITEEQALKEGCKGYECYCKGMAYACTDCYNTGWLESPKSYFMNLWNSTIKKKDLDKYGWEANPWVWVIEFERVKV